MLFLVTNLYDEGLYEENFVVLEAKSALEIATHMQHNPMRWWRFLVNAVPSDWMRGYNNNKSLLELAVEPDITAERFLELIQMTSVDGDSASQLAIHPISVMSVADVDKGN